MKIDVRFRGLADTSGLREHAERRIHFHLSRFGGEIRRVQLGLSDVNGPRGGVDKQCRVTVSGPRLSTVSIEELGPDVYTAAENAIERAGRAVGRALEKRRTARTLLPVARGAW